MQINYSNVRNIKRGTKLTYIPGGIECEVVGWDDSNSDIVHITDDAGESSPVTIDNLVSDYETVD